jgi:capsid assembly protease
MKHLPQTLSRFVQTPLMIHPPKLDVMVAALGPRLGIHVEPSSAADNLPLDLKASYGDAAGDVDYRVEDGIAIIPVQGTLIKKSSWLSSWSGTSSYRDIANQVSAAMEDGGVKGILLDIDSPGGETNGCFELSDYLYSVRGLKPMFAAADDIALSAAYAIASACERIYVTRTGAVGSIGVYALHVDQAAYDAKLGVRYTYVFAGGKKVDGNPHEPLSDRAASDIQEEVDREYDIFTATVARNRKADQKDIIATQAGLYWAEKSIPLLADQVGTREDALEALRAATGTSSVGRGSAKAAAPAAITSEGETGMKNGTTSQAGAPQPKAEGNGTDDDMAKGAPCESESNEPDGDEAEPDGDEPENQDEEENMKNQNANNGAAASAQPGPAATNSEFSRSEKETKTIMGLCRMAGCPDRLGEFLTSRKSVAEISEMLTEERSAAADQTPVNGRSNQGSGPRIQDIETQAEALARQNRGNSMRNLYGFGESPMTKERAYAQALEANPEAYAAYRAQHNARTLVATLEAAGYRLSPR